jgi:N-acetylglucosamine-6-phosphate deacetylase
MRHAGVSLGDAVRMVTANPSRVLDLGVADGHERLAVGMAGNLTSFRLAATGDIEVLATVVAGELVHQA